LFARLRELEAGGGLINVALVGAGLVGRGLVYQLSHTPGMRTALLINRSTEPAVNAFIAIGHESSEIVVSDDPAVLTAAIGAGRPAIATQPEVLTSIDDLDVVVEATGDVTHGALVALLAIAGNKHLVSLNFETDATVGPILRKLADQRGVVYTGSDGDQPGVMMRLIEYVRGIGLDIVVAVNCKGFLDVHATPDSIRPWAEKQKISLKMTTSFTDGTKMNVENACVANASGLRPAKRGMHGIETTLDSALSDFSATLDREGLVDYTLGGDFGSGVFVIGSGAHPELMAPYLEYLKMGQGPWYLFFRPWHLVHMETPISIAEAVLDALPTIAPVGAPVANVLAIAKRDMADGDRLDGIGGFDCYGEIDQTEATEAMLPIGLAEEALLVEPVAMDNPILLNQVEFPASSPIVSMWRAQDEHFSSGGSADVDDLLALWT
jgi:predicted homoserine dehydrogenase-like protein